MSSDNNCSICAQLLQDFNRKIVCSACIKLPENKDHENQLPGCECGGEAGTAGPCPKGCDGLTKKELEQVWERAMNGQRLDELKQEGKCICGKLASQCPCVHKDCRHHLYKDREDSEYIYAYMSDECLCYE